MTPNMSTNTPICVTKALASVPTADIIKPVIATVRQPSICVNPPENVPLYNKNKAKVHAQFT